MFIGHFAVALAAKKVSPKISLGMLFVAVQFLDLLWPILVLLSIEHFRIQPGNTTVTPLEFYDYPISHSLMGAALWGILLGFIGFGKYKDSKSAVILFICVVSHWILDFLSHRTDMPISFTPENYYGLGLWNSLIATMVVEFFLFATGVFFYVKSLKETEQPIKIGFWLLITFLLVIWIMNLFGPPPPNETAVAISANAIWLIVLWAYWIDK